MIEKKEILNDLVIYFARGETSLRITIEGFEQIESLKTNHEEADTKIAYLIKHALDDTGDINHVCVRSSSGDIDIPVILVNAFGDNKHLIYIDNGTGKNRKTIRIDSSKLTQCLETISFPAS